MLVVVWGGVSRGEGGGGGGEGGRGEGGNKITYTIVLYDIMQSHIYCLCLWEKAALHFHCILKSILHGKSVNKLLTSHCTCTLLCACTKHLCM